MAEEEAFQGFPTTQENGGNAAAPSGNVQETPSGFALGAEMAQNEGRSSASSAVSYTHLTLPTKA